MAKATTHPNHSLISSEDVEGTNVYDMKGTKVGEIDHLMIDKVSGRVTYAVMSFGGFLGLGHSHYPIPWGALKYDTSLDGYVTGVTEQQLKDAPAFSDDAWSNRNWGRFAGSARRLGFSVAREGTSASRQAFGRPRGARRVELPSSVLVAWQPAPAP